MNPEQFYQRAQKEGSGDRVPPVEHWDPPLSGEMDLVIKQNGRWVHQGDVIQRADLVRLFSKILRFEHNNYFLVTPIEKWRIRVEDAPFFANRLEVENTGTPNQRLRFFTTTDNRVTASADHPLWVEYNEKGEPRPYVLVRDQLKALIHRQVFLQLAELATEAKSKVSTRWIIASNGCEFLLGEAYENLST